MSIEEVIEELRIWEDRFYSESETKLIMNTAADYLEQYYKNCINLEQTNEE